MKRVLTVLLIVFLASQAMADLTTPPPMVTIKVSPYESLIGDQITIEITVYAPLVREIVPQKLEDSLGSLTIIENRPSIKMTILGGSVLHHNIVATSFITGDLVIPPIQYQILDEAGNAVLVESPELLISVPSISGSSDGPENLAEITDILRPESMQKEGAWPWWYWALVAGLAVAAAIALILYLKNRTPGSVKNLLKLTPAQQAIEDLYKLDQMGLLEQKQFDQFFTQLSRIIRRYLGLRYHIFALEMTSTELKHQIGPIWQDGTFDIERFTQMLEHSDLAKYAKHQPTIQTGEESLETGRQIIYSTRDDLNTGEAG